MACRGPERRGRRFGLTVGAAFAVLTGLMLLRGSGLWPITSVVAALLLLGALAAPRLLSPVERGWMWLAGIMGFVMTNVLLTLVFLIVLTPMGTVMRLLGKDQMMLRRGGDRKSYWRRVDPEGPGSRPEKPF